MTQLAAKARKKQPSLPIRRIGVLGVGIMGLAMASNLVKAGFQVSGYDPNPKALKRLKAAGGKPQPNTAAMASEVDVIICALPGPQALHDAVQHIAASGNRQLVVMAIPRDLDQITGHSAEGLARCFEPFPIFRGQESEQVNKSVMCECVH
jgi:pyrroline-5-carboxylate reductase